MQLKPNKIKVFVFSLLKPYVLLVIFLLAVVLASTVLLWPLDIRVQYFNEATLKPVRIEGIGFPKVLTDATGEKYVLKKPPQRIVSVTLGTDEILSALVDHERIVGVTYLADVVSMSNIPNQYPTRIKRIRGEIEEILALEPDLVFVAGYTRAETVRLLLGAGIPVVRLSQYNSLADIEKNIMTIAEVTDTNEKASALIKSLRAIVETVQEQVSHVKTPRVLVYNLQGYTSGDNTVMDEIIRLAGGYNVMSETGVQGSQKISEEMAIGLAPDVILMSGWSPENKVTPAEQLIQLSAWQYVPAVVNNRVYDLKGAWVLSVSHYSWNGISDVSDLLHPCNVKKC